MSKTLWAVTGLLAVILVALSACSSDKGQPIGEQAAQAPASAATSLVEEEHAGDEILVEGTDISEDKLETGICKHLGLRPLETKKHLFGRFLKSKK